MNGSVIGHNSLELELQPGSGSGLISRAGPLMNVSVSGGFME